MREHYESKSKRNSEVWRAFQIKSDDGFTTLPAIYTDVIEILEQRPTGNSIISTNRLNCLRLKKCFLTNEHIKVLSTAFVSSGPLKNERTLHASHKNGKTLNWSPRSIKKAIDQSLGIVAIYHSYRKRAMYSQEFSWIGLLSTWQISSLTVPEVAFATSHTYLGRY